MVAVLFAFALAAPSPLRLAELLREAREKNPDLKAAEARTEAARESVSPAGALDDPMLMVQLWNAPVDFSSIPVMVQLTQPIPLGGKRAARTDAARADASMAEAELAGKRREIETQVASAYFDLFLAELTGMEDTHAVAPASLCRHQLIHKAQRQNGRIAFILDVGRAEFPGLGRHRCAGQRP